MSVPSPQIFISYQRSDGVIARQIREHLAAHRVRTWMEQYDIPVGGYWTDEIDGRPANTDIGVGILSAYQGWKRRSIRTIGLLQDARSFVRIEEHLATTSTLAKKCNLDATLRMKTTMPATVTGIVFGVLLRKSGEPTRGFEPRTCCLQPAMAA
jgi:hypothetical protein